MQRRDFTTERATDDLQKPEVFIQWKGTDACFDFACDCGAHYHFDGFFAYFVKCGSCGQVWQMPIHLYPQKTDGGPDCEPLVVLEDWQEDE
jgi:hypothetical protein